jgi:two-component system NtrC family sensor kinase
MRARTFRLVLSLLLALAAVALGGWSAHRKVQSFQPIGFEVVTTVYGVEVGRVLDPRTGLREGDLIMLIQGADLSEPSRLPELLRERPQSTLWVERSPERIPQQIVYQRPPLDIDFPYLILALSGVGYLLIGLYTLLRQGTGQGFLFYLWCLTSAVFYLLTPVPPVDGLFKTVYLVDAFARILLPALTLHLFLVFPVPTRSARVRRLLPFLYLPSALLLTLQLDLALNNGGWIFGTPTAERLWVLDRIEIFHLAVFALAAVALLGRRLLRRGAWEQQRQMQWVAFGMGGGYLPFLAFYGVPAIFGLRGPELLQVFAVVPLALVPLTFAYAILRYKLWDIEVIVRDTIASTLTLLLGIVSFSLVNLMISRGVSEDMASARNLLSFMAGLAIAGLLVPTRRGITSTLERFQYRGAFGKRRALSELGRELLHERDLGRLCTNLLRQIEDGVDLEKVNLWLAQGEALVAVRPESDAPERLPFDLLGGEVWDRDHVQLSAVALPMEPETLEQRMFVAGYRYAFPLTLRGRPIGFALVGFKLDHTPLNSDDTELIRHLLDQAALAIENAQLLGQLSVQLEEVRNLQRYTEGIFESSPAGIAVLDGDRRIVSANAAFATLAGRDRGAFLGRPLADVLPLGQLPAPGDNPMEVCDFDATGKERYLQISLSTFEVAGLRSGRDELRVLVVHDVSERVQMEKTLQENERLAALGMLAAGVAHEVNTPITGISSYAQMLLADTAENDPHYEILKKVERQTFRASRIVNNLLELARNRPKERKPVAVTPLLHECVDLLSDRFAKRRVEVAWNLPEEPEGEAMVFGCEGELQQVFTNLLVNAFDAIAGPGAPAITGKCRPRIEIALETDDDALRVSIRDNGPGIPTDKLDAVFQPFYSTKLNRGGTGLGLSISSDLVRRHGGELKAVSEPGAGACFVVEMPRFHEGTAARRSEIPA